MGCVLSRNQSGSGSDDGEVFFSKPVSDNAVASTCIDCGGTLRLRTLACPLCHEKVQDEHDFLGHLKAVHGFEQTIKKVDVPLPIGAVLPRVGNKVLAMWSVSKWQYFHATIVRFISDTLTYEINWDDGDTTGRFVPYYNLALDRIPDETEIGIGSTILFSQGSYKAGQTQLTGGQRWHQGRITNIYVEKGVKYYDGCHTKGPADGKFVTYKDYEYTFYRRTRNDFRVGPNVFDIINEDEGIDMDGDDVDYKDIDIYFSCSKPKVETPLYYPKELTRTLSNLGLKVVEGDVHDVKKRADMIKQSKVIIACINDKYVEDEHCRMEFQFAKSTLRKPVVPVVVGEDMSWNMSVVGMLIAGELYIHFKDESVEEPKIDELVKSLSNHIKTLSSAVEKSHNEGNIPKTGPSDVFISYCWWNSWDAKEKNQIEEVTGTRFSDPRSISRELSARGYNTWLDIERLKSADQNAGLYEQLTEALKKTKIVVPCISDEYASSVNCQMEFKFAIKSLRKRVIPVVVGTGDKWKETVIGVLLDSFNIEPIVFQLTEDKETFESKLNSLIDRIRTALDEDEGEGCTDSGNEGDDVEEIIKLPPVVRCSSVPVVGDHVISHHFRWTYYMATVVSFDKLNMEYTVAWDDGDSTGTVQPFNQIYQKILKLGVKKNIISFNSEICMPSKDGVSSVAKDFEPAEDEIGVGTIIFFPQGSYGSTEGSNEGGIRYHEGVVTSITRCGEVLISGHHTHTEEDGKWITYGNYSHEFHDIPISLIRLAPTALESFGM